METDGQYKGRTAATFALRRYTALRIANESGAALDSVVARPVAVPEEPPERQMNATTS